jgi:uncharacterized protein YndB with AHSA1/START domain
MAESRFIYVTYIRATPQQVWDGLTQPEFTRQYWAGTTQRSDWSVGAPWAAYTPDERAWDVGRIVEIDEPRRLVLTWRNEHFPELRAEGFTRVVYEIETVEDCVKLTLTQEVDVENSKIVEAMSQGWPAVFASLKSLLETGEPLQFTRQWPKGL